MESVQALIDLLHAGSETQANVRIPAEGHAGDQGYVGLIQYGVGKGNGTGHAELVITSGNVSKAIKSAQTIIISDNLWGPCVWSL